MRRTQWSASVVVCAIVVVGVAVRAQDPVPTTEIRILGVGGFLGYPDGLADDLDNLTMTHGGFIGVRDWLSSNRTPADIVLITGNNVPFKGSEETGTTTGSPLNPAWGELAAMRPDAVLLGIDDFLRSLQGADNGGELVAAFGLQPPAVPPFVVSNAFVKIHKKHLNDVESHGLKLEIDRNESVGWRSTMRVACDPCVPVNARIEEDNTQHPGTTPLSIVVTPTVDPDKRHISLKFEPYLRPERRYTLSLTQTDYPVTTATFHFETHIPLTRLDAPGIPEGRKGVPVRYVVRGAPVVILGMVDPGTKARLGTKQWRWKPTEVEGSPSCGGDECEIDFMPAIDAFKALSSYFAPPKGGSDPGPLYAVISGLSDEQTLALTTETPSIRFVLLDPDSSLLGPDPSEQAIMNEKTDTATGLWARPTWIGGHVDTLTTQIWRKPVARRGDQATTSQAKGEPDKPADDMPTEWAFKAPKIDITPVPGATLTPMRDGDDISYTLSGQTSTTTRHYHAYETPASAAVANGIWGNRAEMGALFLDVMRRETHSDVAVLPSHFVDRDITDWLAARAKNESLNWLSEFILSKTMYRMERIVTTDVEGSKLAGVLDTLAKSVAMNAGEETLIAGIGEHSGVTAIDADHFILNNRPLMTNHFYKIALPESLADSQKLPRAHASIDSLFAKTDARLRSPSSRTPLTGAAVAKGLDDEFSRRDGIYLGVTPARFNWFQARPTDKDGAFANIPLEGRTVKKERQWGASGKADLGYDLTHFAFRVTGELKYAENTVGTGVSFPDDEWTGGTRADYKLGRTSDQRLFVGYFKQAQIRHHPADPVTPTRPLEAIDPSSGAVFKTTTTGARVTPVLEKPAYKFARAGIDFMTWKPPVLTWLTISDGMFAIDMGRTYNDRRGVIIEDIPDLKIADLFTLGTQKFVNRAFEKNPSAFTSARELTFAYADHRQTRMQVQGTIEMKPGKPRLHDMKLTNTLQFRWYFRNALRPDFTPNKSLDVKTQLDWTVVNNLKFGPFVNYYVVTAQNAPRRFDYVKVGVEFGLPIFMGFAPMHILH
jgi:hypothetical protein